MHKDFNLKKKKKWDEGCIMGKKNIIKPKKNQKNQKKSIKNRFSAIFITQKYFSRTYLK